MPSIYFEGPAMDVDKKRKLAQTFTEAASEATGIPAPSITVIFRANNLDDVSVGGKLLIDRNK